MAIDQGKSSSGAGVGAPPATRALIFKGKMSPGKYDCIFRTGSHTGATEQAEGIIHLHLQVKMSVRDWFFKQSITPVGGIDQPGNWDMEFLVA